MEFSRELYMKRLIRSRGNRLIKVITGIRGCGKTYLLHTLFYRYLLQQKVPENHIIRIAFDSREDLLRIGESLPSVEERKGQVSPDILMNYLNSVIQDNCCYYLLLDEIPLLGCFDMVLSSLHHRLNLDLYVTGSNARFLSRDMGDVFAGQGQRIQMYPLTYSEYLSAFPGDRQEQLETYLRYGGFPSVVMAETPEEKESILAAMDQRICIRDIVKKNRIRKYSEFNLLADHITCNVGNLFTHTSVWRELYEEQGQKISIKAFTMGKYINDMSNAFWIDASALHDQQIGVDSEWSFGDESEHPCRYFFSDFGLLKAHVGIRGPDHSGTMETLIYHELLMRSWRVETGVTKADSDVWPKLGFLCHSGIRRYAIWYIPTLPEGEQLPEGLVGVGGRYQKVIVTDDPAPAESENGEFRIFGLFEFLLNPDLLD